MRDLMNNIDIKRGISPAVVTNANTAYVSQILDTQGLKSATFVFATGALTDANATFTTLVEDGDNSALSDNVAVDDAFLIGTELLATPLFSSDDKVFKIGLRDTRRYARVTITPAGNDSGAINLGGFWITEPLLKPSANPPA